VDDVATVCVGDGVCDGNDVVKERETLVDGLALGEEVPERTAGDELHGIERCPVGPAAGLVDWNDAGVLEASGDEGLAHEANFVHRAAREQLLDGDIAAELEVVGTRDLAETAATVLAEMMIARWVAHLRHHGPRLDRR